jgi:hypothetical protein
VSLPACRDRMSAGGAGRARVGVPSPRVRVHASGLSPTCATRAAAPALLLSEPSKLNRARLVLVRMPPSAVRSITRFEIDGPGGAGPVPPRMTRWANLASCAKLQTGARAPDEAVVVSRPGAGRRLHDRAQTVADDAAHSGSARGTGGRHFPQGRAERRRRRQRSRRRAGRASGRRAGLGDRVRRYGQVGCRARGQHAEAGPPGARRQSAGDRL